MFRLMRGCVSISLCLSSTAFPDSCYPEYIETDLEWSGFIEELGLDKDVKNLLKGFYSINANSSPRYMAQVASKLLKDLNRQYKTNVTIDHGIHKMAEIFKEKQIRVNKNSIVSMRDVLTQELNRLGVEHDGLYELMVGDWDTMSNREALILTQVFCGCLLLFIPHPIVQGVGATLISEAVIDCVKNGMN